MEAPFTRCGRLRFDVGKPEDELNNCEDDWDATMVIVKAVSKVMDKKATSTFETCPYKQVALLKRSGFNNSTFHFVYSA